MKECSLLWLRMHPPITYLDHTLVEVKVELRFLAQDAGIAEVAKRQSIVSPRPWSS